MPHPINCKPYMSTKNCTAAQTTLGKRVSLSGTGVHTGLSVRVTLCPAAANSGVTWVRSDLPAGLGEIVGRWDRVSNTRLSTVLANAHGASVSTVEHLMAALRATGVDNVRIEIDGPEVPIVDGSAAPWMLLIAQAGIVSQAVRRRAIRVLRPIQVDDGDGFLRVSPFPHERFSVEIEFADPAIGRQLYSFEPRSARFAEDIAPARTFGFLADIEALRERGLTLGGSLDNAVVVDRGRVLNRDGLRFEDEFVRHKILDCIGDLYLAGAPLIGHVEGRKVGHTLNNRLLRALFAQPDAWVWDSTGCDDVPLPGARMAA